MNGFFYHSYKPRKSARNHRSMLLLRLRVAAIVLLSLQIGCGKKDVPQTSVKTETAQPTLASPGVIGQIEAATPNSGPDGQTILRNLNARYAAAKSYRDKAILYLLDEWLWHCRCYELPTAPMGGWCIKPLRDKMKCGRLIPFPRIFRTQRQ